MDLINANKNKKLPSVNALSVIDNIGFSKYRFMKIQLLGHMTGFEQIEHTFYPRTMWNKRTCWSLV